jgi:hypothetical protein
MSAPAKTTKKSPKLSPLVRSAPAKLGRPPTPKKSKVKKSKVKKSTKSPKRSPKGKKKSSKKEDDILYLALAGLAGIGLMALAL